jgi:SAM-dependent methyltransferase
VPTAKHRSDFDTLAREYARYRSSYSDALFDAIVDYARPTAGRRALDIACGTGLSTQGLVARGIAVTGVDVAANMLDAARASIEGATFFAARAESLPFADQAFGLVICGQAFHWFDGPPVYRQIERVLVRDGALAMFWKDAVMDDAFTKAADALEREWSGRDPAILANDLSGGLREDWKAARFVDRKKIVFDVRLPFTVESFVGYHGSRETLRIALGERRHAYLTALRSLIAGMAGESESFEVEAKETLFLGRRSALP